MMSILPQLERDLSEAAARTLPSTGGPRVSVRLRRGRSVLAVALPALVAAVVAVAALGLFARQHSAPASASRSPRAQLLQSLAVLRLAQVPADRDPELIKTYAFPITARARYGRRSVLRRLGYPRLDTGLLRIVRIASLRARVLIAPTTYRPSATSRRRVEGISVALQSPGNDMTGTGPRPTSVSGFEAHGLAIGFGAPDGTSLTVLLVPDGVARVVIGPPRPLRFQAPEGVGAAKLARAIARVTGSAIVRDNLGAFRFALPTLATSSALSGFYGITTMAPATWYAADGSVLRHTTTELDLLIRVIDRTPDARLRKLCGPRALPRDCKR
jgi:hypothetical protein